VKGFSASRDRRVVRSDREFGITFAALFVVVGVTRGLRLQVWSAAPFAGAAALAAMAVWAPRALHPFAVAWARLGKLLHRVTSPIVLALIYFAVITPTAAILRAAGRDLLALQRDPRAPSYWRERPAGAAGRGTSMQRQF
jgi:hypothetical protein